MDIHQILKTLPDNASGKFVAGSTITVIYNYIKKIMVKQLKMM